VRLCLLLLMMNFSICNLWIEQQLYSSSQGILKMQLGGWRRILIRAERCSNFCKENGLMAKMEQLWANELDGQLVLPYFSHVYDKAKSPCCKIWDGFNVLSCTNTSCKDDIVLNRWERLLRATEWPVTTVTVTHINCNDRNENKSIYTILSPTQTTQVATKRMKYSLCTKK
jgi:hypothetical protein